MGKRRLRLLLTVWLLAVAVLLGAGPAYALEKSRASINKVSKAYGYLLGQAYSLDRVAREYPNLAGHAAVAKSLFDAAFANPEATLEAELRSTLPPGDFERVKERILEKTAATLSQQAITEAIARTFVSTVQSRAKGESVEPDVLQTLLAVKYQANPVAEFLDGWRQRYQTDGSGKSLGLRLALQLPKSWFAREAERPHILQKWLSEGGSGRGLIMVMVVNGAGPEPSAQEVKASVQSGEIKEWLPENAKLIGTKTFTLETRTGFSMDFSIDQERAWFELYQRSTTYNLFFRDWFIQITCGAMSEQTDRKTADAEFIRIKPICQQVLNSLVLPQAYR